MEFIQSLIDFILHIDRHLVELTAAYGVWVYGILFVIVFCETGLVVTPFLPGDSLLFAVGSLAAIGAMDLVTSIVLLVAAAFIGDTVNYWIGWYVGPKVFHEEHSRFLNKEYLQRTHRFYEKHGGKTIVIARFLPIIRTFAPFVAGIGRMSYRRFMIYTWGEAFSGCCYSSSADSSSARFPSSNAISALSSSRWSLSPGSRPPWNSSVISLSGARSAGRRPPHPDRSGGTAG